LRSPEAHFGRLRGTLDDHPPEDLLDIRTISEILEEISENLEIRGVSRTTFFSPNMGSKC